MSYVISFCDDSGMFFMEGSYEHFIGEHFLTIARKESLQEQVVKALSETHALAILRANGVEIELVDIDW